MHFEIGSFKQVNLKVRVEHNTNIVINNNISTLK